MKLLVKVVPHSSRSGVSGWMGHVIKICVTAPPERGKANAAVEAVLCRALGIPKGWVRVVAGERSTRKVIEVEGLNETEIHARLKSAITG